MAGSRYLSPKSLALALGVSESSVKRWADDGLIEASRTAGGHRRIARNDALAYIRARGLTLADPGAIGLDVLETVRGSPDNETLKLAVLEGWEEQARGILIARYLNGESIAALCDGPIAESLREVGELWEHGDEGIYREHRATEICLQALTVLRTLLPRCDPGAPVAIGCAPPGDPYRIPSLMASLVLAAAGWNERNLGADLPLRALLAAMDQYRPRLVWLSFFSDAAARRFPLEDDRLSERAAALDSVIVVGGRTCPRALAGGNGPFHCIGSMTALDAFARALKLRPAAATPGTHAPSPPAGAAGTDPDHPSRGPA